MGRSRSAESPTTGRSPGSRPEATATIGIFAFSPDGRYLATAHFPGEALSVWDIDRHTVAVNEPGPVRDRARFSPDSRRIAVAHEEWRPARVRPGDWPAQPARRVPKPGPLAFRFDAAQIAVISDEKGPTCRILETETGRLVRSIPLRASGVGVQWSPDGTTLTTPCEDRMIYLWDAATGTLKVSLRGHTSGGLGSTFHPAGTLLASNGWETRLWLWDPVLGKPWLNLPGAAITSLAGTGESSFRSSTKLRPTWSIRPSNTGRLPMLAADRMSMEK